MNTSTPTT
jgi:hypothetical protein